MDTKVKQHKRDRTCLNPNQKILWGNPDTEGNSASRSISTRCMRLLTLIRIQIAYLHMHIAFTYLCVLRITLAAHNGLDSDRHPVFSGSIPSREAVPGNTRVFTCLFCNYSKSFVYLLSFFPSLYKAFDPNAALFFECYSLFKKTRNSRKENKL